MGWEAVSGIIPLEGGQWFHTRGLDSGFKAIIQSMLNFVDRLLYHAIDPLTIAGQTIRTASFVNGIPTRQIR